MGIETLLTVLAREAEDRTPTAAMVCTSAVGSNNNDIDNRQCLSRTPKYLLTYIISIRLLAIQVGGRCSSFAVLMVLDTRVVT